MYRIRRKQQKGDKPKRVIRVVLSKKARGNGIDPELVEAIQDRYGTPFEQRKLEYAKRSLLGTGRTIKERAESIVWPSRMRR